MDNTILVNKNILYDALNLWWLRPENALALSSYVIRGVDLLPKPGENSADYACGDGVNTFFKCGGRFDKNFDVFQSGILKGETKDIALKSVDVFDHFEEDYSPQIIQRPSQKYNFGTDHKNNLLKKAEKLDFYNKLVLVNLEDEVQEINNESLDLIYCNSLYWVKRTDLALQHMVKKLKNNGKLIIDVFTVNKKSLDFGHMFPFSSPEWAEMLNRGRQATNPGLRSERGWDDLFGSAGLDIMDKRDILPPAISKMWNVGLRPIFPMINKMSSRLNAVDRIEIKEEWVEVFTDLLLPILEDAELYSTDINHYRIQYVLTKQE